MEKERFAFHNGIPLWYKFTPDETNVLKDVLRSFDQKKVEGFLSHLSVMPFIPLFAIFKERTFPKEAVEGHLKNIKECGKTLEKLLRASIPIRNGTSTPSAIRRSGAGSLPGTFAFRMQRKPFRISRPLSKPLPGYWPRQKEAAEGPRPIRRALSRRSPNSTKPSSVKNRPGTRRHVLEFGNSTLQYSISKTGRKRSRRFESYPCRYPAQKAVRGHRMSQEPL